MADLDKTEPFWPSKIVRVTPETIKEVTRDGGERIAAECLKQIPSIPAGATILDIGCGAGAATAMIMASVSPGVARSIKITGTDIDENALKAYRERATASSWPAEAVVMDAHALSFPDNTFTHCIGNAMIFLTRDNGVIAAKEMLRTLKPGGTLIVNCFGPSTHLNAVREASRATRSGGVLPAWDSFENWQDPAFIANTLEAAGFEKEKIDVQRREVLMDVGNFDRHALVTWSFRGMPATGWSVEDDEKWDEAVSIVKRELRQADGFKILDDGSAVSTALMNVATAAK